MLVDGRLVAILVHLTGPYNTPKLRGKWFVEVGFGPPLSKARTLFHPGGNGGVGPSALSGRGETRIRTDVAVVTPVADVTQSGDHGSDHPALLTNELVMPLAAMTLSLRRVVMSNYIPNAKIICDVSKGLHRSQDAHAWFM